MTVLTGMNVQRKNNKITDPLIAEYICNEGISAFFLFVCNIVKRCVILNPKVTTWGVIMKTKDKDQGIDFVIAWVDGNDPAWQEERHKDEYSVGGRLLQPDGQHDPEVPERGTQGFFADRR